MSLEFSPQTLILELERQIQSIRDNVLVKQTRIDELQNIILEKQAIQISEGGESRVSEGIISELGKLQLDIRNPFGIEGTAGQDFQKIDTLNKQIQIFQDEITVRESFSTNPQELQLSSDRIRNIALVAIGAALIL